MLTFILGCLLCEVCLQTSIISDVACRLNWGGEGALQTGYVAEIAILSNLSDSVMHPEN